MKNEFNDILHSKFMKLWFRQKPYFKREVIYNLTTNLVQTTVAQCFVCASFVILHLFFFDDCLPILYKNQVGR